MKYTPRAVNNKCTLYRPIWKNIVTLAHAKADIKATWVVLHLRYLQALETKIQHETKE
jgi:hypothetical protein